MNLKKKKLLAAKTVGLGMERVVFNKERLDEIKEAITKQDIRDLIASRAIMIREVKGTRKVERKKQRRRAGSLRKKVKIRKRKYLMLTRKLRAYVAELKKQGRITQEQRGILRKELRAKMFKDKVHLKERIKAFGGKQK